MSILYVKKKWVTLATVIFIIGAGWYVSKPDAITTFGQAAKEEYVIQMVTSEIKTKTDDGKEIESYRFDPGTIPVPQGEEVTLRIYGVNGHEHPFYIEGTDVKGIVKKGEETVVSMRFEEEGIYRIICTAHETIAQDGPMVGYIVVD